MISKDEFMKIAFKTIDYIDDLLDEINNLKRENDLLKKILNSKGE